MNMLDLSLLQQLVLVLSALVLLSSFMLLYQTRLVTAIHVFAWQGAMVAAITFLVAATTDSTHLYISALLTLLLKSLLIPWMLHRLVRQLDLVNYTEELTHPALTIMAAVALVLFSYWLVLPLVSQEMLFTRNIVAVSLAALLIGLLMMVMRRKAVLEVLGFMAIENGLFLAAVSATEGMPLVVELGVAFDVLVAMILFGVFFFQIRESIDSLDVDRLSLLNDSAELDK